MTGLAQLAQHAFLTGLVIVALAFVWLTRLDRRP
jgi:hypothetical protein